MLDLKFSQEFPGIPFRTVVPIISFFVHGDKARIDGNHWILCVGGVGGCRWIGQNVLGCS